MGLFSKLFSMKRQPSENWDNELAWCPSQCYLTPEDNITLYMRWRYKDPWTMDVIYGDIHSRDSIWYIVDNSLHYFRDDEYKKAQVWFEKWWKKNRKKVIKYFNETRGTIPKEN